MTALELTNELLDRLEIAIEALKLIRDKSPGCDCMDAPAIAKQALKDIREQS